MRGASSHFYESKAITCAGSMGCSLSSLESERTTQPCEGLSSVSSLVGGPFVAAHIKDTRCRGAQGHQGMDEASIWALT